MGNKTINFEGINLKITEEVENGKVEATSNVGNLYYLHFENGQAVKIDPIDIITTEWEFQK